MGGERPATAGLGLLQIDTSALRKKFAVSILSGDKTVYSCTALGLVRPRCGQL